VAHFCSKFKFEAHFC